MNKLSILRMFLALVSPLQLWGQDGALAVAVSGTVQAAEPVSLRLNGLFRNHAVWLVGSSAQASGCWLTEKVK